MRTKNLLTILAAATAVAATSAQAAVINVTDFSATPDGSTTTFEQIVDVKTPNDSGANILNNSAGSTAYFVTTFTFGTGTSADLTVQFRVNTANRLGITVQDTGLVSTTGDAALIIDYDALTAQPSRTTFNIGQSLVGQTVTLIAKFHYASDVSDTYNTRFNNGPQTPSNADTLMNVWVNPTASSTEGSGPAAGDLYSVWDSNNFNNFRQGIANQSTPETAGDSSITNTRIFTGDEATFANALAFATIPEPSTALLGGLGLLALLRRRRS